MYVSRRSLASLCFSFFFVSGLNNSPARARGVTISREKAGFSCSEVVVATYVVISQFRADNISALVPAARDAPRGNGTAKGRPKIPVVRIAARRCASAA
jgi:hypothetical protein